MWPRTSRLCIRVAAGRVPQAGFKPSFPRLPNEELWERGNRGWVERGNVGAYRKGKEVSTEEGPEVLHQM